MECKNFFWKKYAVHEYEVFLGIWAQDFLKKSDCPTRKCEILKVLGYINILMSAVKFFFGK